MSPESPSTGRIIYTPPGDGHHRCDRPDQVSTMVPGTIWRCDCGQSWTVEKSFRCPYWREATLTERLKARLHTHLGSERIRGGRGD